MADEQPKIVVEVPGDRGYAPLPAPKTNKLEEFKKGWINAIAMPDCVADMAFVVTAFVTIPALLTSCWVSFPLPSFVRLGVLGVLAITGAVLCYLRQAVPEVDEELTFRACLVVLGVILGL
ncbi:MAG: hypothetical protein RMY28_037325 [Nostoc sp. ChiSLP01]|nr:hypothetical protein [Nostoc sp. CmiSLP01]MDZ8287362.1 hypothetical protein [Nostoc sp. ChiSLP01]